jgi:hypothetical protein
MQADVGLQPADAIAILQRRRTAGQLGDVVVVHTGTNGNFTTEQLPTGAGQASGCFLLPVPLCAL